MRSTAITFSVILLSWVLGFFGFIYVIGNYELDTSTRTEAIVIFGDNKQKLYTAAALLKLGYAPLILLTNDENPTSYKNYLKEQGVPEYQVILDPEILRGNKHYPTNTYLLLKKYGISSIRLVTLAEEMPRAIYETTRYLPRGAIVPHIVLVKNKSYRSIFVEYNKYLLTILLSIFGLQDEFSISYS
jgi:uncharacterized SAM-binding protein YcdF (DUF218 family)